MPAKGSARVDDPATANRPDHTPESVEELRDIVAGSSTSLLVFGGGTKLSFGNTGDSHGSTVSTSHLTEVLQYEPADLTIGVEAGMTVGELNRILGKNNQMLPFDCPHPERSTLGGMYASGLGGPRRLKYGSLRDWVLGVEVLGGSGLITRSGGMVVKNVTGYDLPRLHFGAHGAFGIVTRLNMKVLPREESTRTIQIRCANVDDAYNAGIELLGSQLEPTSITISNADEWRLSVGCAAPESSIDSLTTAITELAQATATSTNIDVEDSDQMATRDYREVIDLTGDKAVARLSVPASEQLQVLKHFSALSGSTLCADPGAGLVYVSGLPSLEWREVVRKSNDDVVFLSLPEALKSGVDVFGRMDDASRRLLSRLKDEFDPDNRLNTGRFIAGI